MNDSGTSICVSIIIVNWNSKDYLQRCLRSLSEKAASVSHEVIVVDGASFDGCGEMLAQEFPSVFFIQSPDNIGFARANNLGARQAQGKYLLLLNPDTLFIENTIRIMLDRIESLPKAGAVGCKLLNADRSLQTSCVQAFPTVLNQALDSEFLRRQCPDWKMWGMTCFNASSSQPFPVEVISGACILVPRAVFTAVGGFTEHYFMYSEDVDLCYKIKQSGYTVYYTSETSLVHFGGASSGQAVSNFATIMLRQSIYDYFCLNRNRLVAIAYRSAMAVSALVRLLGMAPLMLFRKRIVQHGAGSMQKWLAVLRWSSGFATAARPKLPCPAK
jgi:GT2 family glycosyltransferase